MDIENFQEYINAKLTASSREKIPILVKRTREKLKLSQEEFGKLFNPPIKQQSIAAWEKGKAFPSENNLLKIAILLNIEFNYLMRILRQ